MINLICKRTELQKYTSEKGELFLWNFCPLANNGIEKFYLSFGASVATLSECVSHSMFNKMENKTNTWHKFAVSCESA